MASLLSRYLDAQMLGRMGDQTVEPRGLVMGTLAGAHKSPLSGFAVEFAGHREYVRGDDPRHIDWKLYYKRDRFFIKQYEMETNFVCHLLLDVSASMRYGEGSQQKLAYAAALTAALGHAIVRQNDKVSLSTFDDVVRGHVPAGNSMAQIVRMTEHLDRLDPVQKTRMPDCLSELTGRTGRREIIMIFSDCLSTDLAALESTLQRMRYRKHEVVLFNVLHRHERTFQFEGMVKFMGLEAGEEILCQSEDVRRAYLSALEAHQTELRGVCHRNQIELVDVNTSLGAGELLADYLNQRRTLRLR